MLFDLLEPRVFECLRCGDSVIRIIDEQFHDEVLDVGGRMRNQLRDACALNGREVELHVRRVLLEFIKQGLVWRPEYVVYFMYLVQFVVSWE